MPKTRQDIVERIEKLMALSQSSNPAEAAAALSRAQKLMAEYDISSQDVDMNGIGEEESIPMAGLKGRRLVCILADIVCDCFGLDFFFDWATSSTLKSVTFIGPKDRLASGIYVYTFLQRQLKIARDEYRQETRARLEKQYLDLYEQYFTKHPDAAFKYRCYCGKKPNRQNLRDYEPIKKEVKSQLEKGLRIYAEGWAEAVYQKVQKFAVDEHEQMLIEDYTREHHPNLRVSHGRARSFTDAEYAEYKKGIRDGSEGFDLYKGVNGLSSPRLEKF